MRITITQGHLVRRSKANGTSASDTARKFGLPTRLVLDLYAGIEPLGGFIAPTVVDPDFEDQGRADIRKFLIARKIPDGSWPKSLAISQAQQDYDRGEVELAQGRSSKFIFLYAIPRKEKKPRRHPYFGRTPITIPPEE